MSSLALGQSFCECGAVVLVGCSTIDCNPRRAIASLDRISLPREIGEYVTGEIKLNLPLCTEITPTQVQQTLMHRWKINSISADVTPYTAHPENPRLFTRDDSRVRYQDVPSTRSVKAADYILHCTDIPLPSE